MRKVATAHRLALTLSACSLLVFGAGCGSDKTSSSENASEVHVLVANAAKVLHGRRLAVSIGTPNTRDIWVLEHGRLKDVSRRARIAIGGTGCHYTDPDPVPCYPYTEPFSLSPDGSRLAYFLSFPVVGASDMLVALVVSRSDGSHAHKVASSLGICALCEVSTPSWDRKGRSFVVSIAVPAESITPAFNTKIFRITTAGKVTMLTAPGLRTQGESQPAVSPDGSQIAFLRNVGRGSTSSLSAPNSHVYVMRRNGQGRTGLPLQSRGYTGLWWCRDKGGSAICVDAPTQRLNAQDNAYRLGLRSGRFTHIVRWPEARYEGLSIGARFALHEQRTSHGWEVLAGPIDTAGKAHFAPVISAPQSKKDPFWGFSVTGP